MSGEPDGGGSVTHVLNPVLRAQIRDALCEIDRLSEEEEQRSLLNYLVSSRAHNRVQHGPLLRFVERLIDHCVRRSAFLDLSRWILSWDEHSLQAQAVVKLLVPLVEKEENDTLCPLLLVSDADLAEVRRELTRVAYGGMVEVAFKAVRSRSTAQEHLPAPRNAWEALVCLAQLPAVQGEMPVHSMCRQLARYLPRLFCADLLAYWGRASTPEIERSEPPPVEAPARLVVWVGHGTRRDSYELESWAVLSQRSGSEPEFLEHWIDREIAPGEIAARVGDRLAQVREDVRTSNHGALRIEVVAPVTLMASLRAELWQSQEIPGRERLGSRAEMVYRAVEMADQRLDKARCAWQRAQKRWGSLCENRRASALDLFHTGDINERLLQKRDICFSVPGGLKQHARHVEQVLEHGVPVLVWHSGERSGSIHDWLNPVKLAGEVTLRADQVYGLPTALLRSRTGAASDTDSVYIEDGFAVALMFHDDLPVRPPQAPFSADRIH